MLERSNGSGVIAASGSREESERGQADRPRPVIGRQLAVAFGVVAAISITMGFVECLLVFQASRLVSHMQTMEEGFGSGARLTSAVREQYIHQAHWIIDRDKRHVEHTRNAAAEVRKEIGTLLGHANPQQKAALRQLERGSRELTRVFEEQVMPAVESNDAALVARYHGETHRISRAINAEADWIESEGVLAMARMHEKAIWTTQLGAWIAVVCISSVLLASCYFVLKLRHAIARPVEEMAQAARVFGRGDFHARVTTSAEGELKALADAFNHMARELSLRERRLIHGERMAAVGQLAAGLAHEINNPIGIIRGYLKTMNPESPREQLREEIRILDEEAAACQRLARDLLDFSRTSTLRLAMADMEHVLSQTVQRFLETPAAKGRAIRVDAGPGAIRADEGRIRQVVLNLLTNAVEHSPVRTAIEVSGNPTAQGGYAFSVADRGPGIAAENREKVFEPFFSVSANGSGLGLTVCQGIVRAHAGTISIHDRAGGGTLVEVTLPPTSPPQSGEVT